jgi:peroxiredoxin Q/BCP
MPTVKLKLKLICMVAVFICSCSVQAQTTNEFTLKSPTADSSFVLKQHRGKYVVLHFLLKTECPYCLRYTHEYALLAEKDSESVHVFIKPDTDEEISKWAVGLDKTALARSPIIYRDPNARLAKAFKVKDGYRFHGQSVHYPALVILDTNGEEAFRYVGKSNADRMKTDDFVKVLAELRDASNAAK